MGREWAIYEKEYIEENYLTQGAKHCAEYLNRTEWAVHKMANRLGFKNYIKQERGEDVDIPLEGGV